MYRREVTLQDAVVAVTLMECSMQSSALLGGVNVLHSAFPASAEDEYALQGRGSFLVDVVVWKFNVGWIFYMYM